MRVLWITCVALFALAGCNSGDIGSSCSGGPNEPGLCVEGAVCTPDLDEGAAPPDPPNAVGSTCRQLCDSEADCPEPGFGCRVVPTSMFRACQPTGEPPADVDAGP